MLYKSSEPCKSLMSILKYKMDCCNTLHIKSFLRSYVLYLYFTFKIFWRLLNYLFSSAFIIEIISSKSLSSVGILQYVGIPFPPSNNRWIFTLFQSTDIG